VKPGTEEAKQICCSSLPSQDKLVLGTAETKCNESLENYYRNEVAAFDCGSLPKFLEAGRNVVKLLSFFVF